MTTLARASTWRNRQSRDVWSLANTKLFIVHCWKRERASSARVPEPSLDFHLFRWCRHDSARVEMPVGMLVVVSSRAFLLLPRSASASSKGTANDRWRAVISSQSAGRRGGYTCDACSINEARDRVCCSCWLRQDVSRKHLMRGLILLTGRLTRKSGNACMPRSQSPQRQELSRR